MRERLARRSSEEEVAVDDAYGSPFGESDWPSESRRLADECHSESDAEDEQIASALAGCLSKSPRLADEVSEHSSGEGAEEHSSGEGARAEDSLSTGSSSTAEFLRREGRVVH